MTSDHVKSDTASKRKKPTTFSEELNDWLRHGHDKTITGLIDVFGEKSFAIVFLVMMALPALPIPTGGVTHVTEIITALVALQMIVGLKKLNLPGRWNKFNIGKLMAGKAAGKLIGVVAWFEKYSRKRFSGAMRSTILSSMIGLFVLVFTVAAFVAPPFSGLDTLPALGVVVISLSIILEDISFLIIGIALGVTGIGLEMTAGAALYKGLTHFF